MTESVSGHTVSEREVWRIEESADHVWVCLDRGDAVPLYIARCDTYKRARQIAIAMQNREAYGALLDAAKAVIADMHEFNRATGRGAHLPEYECRECRRDPLNKPGYRCAYHALRAVIASAEHTEGSTQ